MKRLVLVCVAVAAIACAAIGFFIWHSGPATGSRPAPASAMAAVDPAPPSDCLLPGPPPVPPNGAVASADDMKLGRDVMQGFVLQLEAYQACRNNQIDHAAASVTPAQKQDWLAQGNDAIDEATALAAAFGDQLKIFKARNGGE